METRNVTITLNKAKEWYNSEDSSLKEIALQAFSKYELTYNFEYITTFKEACEILNINYETVSIYTNTIAKYSKASTAMFKLNIVRKALNLGQDLHLTKDQKHSCIYYPYNPFVTESSIYYENKLNSGKMEIIGKIKSEGTFYNILNGEPLNGSGAALGGFYSLDGVGSASANIGFFGCASKKIAQHFGKYFGMLITEAKYGDLVDFEIISDKYHNC